VLDVLRRDVHAAGSDDQVLLPIRDEEEPVLVDAPDIPRMKPPRRLEHFGGGLWLLVVAARRAVPAPGHDLPIVGDPYLDSRQRPAHGAKLVVARAVEGQDRTGFREPISLEEENARRMKELRDVARQRSAARDRPPQAAAERR